MSACSTCSRYRDRGGQERRPFRQHSPPPQSQAILVTMQRRSNPARINPASGYGIIYVSARTSRHSLTMIPYADSGATGHAIRSEQQINFRFVTGAGPECVRAEHAGRMAEW
jgi:hypothetical protein